jgi:hypothetical protein
VAAIPAGVQALVRAATRSWSRRGRKSPGSATRHWAGRQIVARRARCSGRELILKVKGRCRRSTPPRRPDPLTYLHLAPDLELP